MIELIESMEELIHQNKSIEQSNMLLSKILEKITLKFMPYRRNITLSPSKEFWLPLEKEKYKFFSAKIHFAQPHFKTLMSKCPKKIKLFYFNFRPGLQK